MKIRSKEYIGYKMRTLLLTIGLLWSVSLLSPVFGQSNVRHYGGKNDGYTKGCVAPVIQSVKPLKNGGCVEEGDLAISVVATGTDISYRWQKQNTGTQIFEDYTPKEESQVEGIDGPVLHFIKTTELDNGYYRCVLSNQCSDEVISDTFFVSISSKPVIKSGLFDRNVCVGEKIMYNVVVEALGEQNYTYQWYKNGYLIDGVTNSFYTFNAAANNTTTDTYIVKITNKCGSVQDTSALTISTLPQIEVYNDAVWVCRDSSVTLSVKLKEGGDYTYELYKVAYPSLAETMVWQGITNSCTLHSVVESGVYRWKVLSDCGFVYSDLIEVKVEDVPVISLQPQSDTVCEGTTVVLSCATFSAISQPLSYVWYKDGVPGVKTTQSYLRIPNVAMKDAGAYRCEVFNSCPSVKSDVAHLEILKKPSFIIQPELVGYYCESDTVTISATLGTDVVVDSVRWFYGNHPLKDGAHIAGSMTNALKIKGLEAADAVNSFYLVAYSHCGQVQSASVKIDLHYPARFVRNSSNDVELILCGGENQVLYVSATGSDSIRYTWTYNGKIVADGYSNRLTVQGGGLDNSGEYICQIQNGCGNDKTVSYVKQSMPPLSDFQGGGHYCADESGVGACLLVPKKYITYQLYQKRSGENGTPIGGKVSADTVIGNICYKDLLKGTYYVVASDTNSCERVMNGEVLVVEDSLPIDYTLKVAREICKGVPDGDLVLENSQSGLVYYLCKYNGTGWDTLSAPYHGTGREMPMTHIGAGQYKLVGYNPLTGCMGGLTTVVTLAERPLPQLYDLFFKNNDSIYCANAKSDVVLQYRQSTSGYKYQLKMNGADYGPEHTASSVIWNELPGGNYTLEVANEWGCKAETPEKIVIPQQPPTAYNLSGNRYFCPEITSEQLTLQGSDFGYTYQFRSLSRRVSLDTVSTGGPILLKVPAVSDSYYVIAIDNTPEKCRSYTDTVFMERSNIKADPRTINTDYGIAVKLEVNVHGYIGGEDDLAYQWDNADKIDGSASVKDPMTTVITESRQYKVAVTDSVGCTDTAKITVRCYGGLLVGDIRLDDCMTDAGDSVTLCLGRKINFCGMVSGGFENRGFEYLWWDRSGSQGTSSSLSNYAPITSGYLYWKIINGADSVVDSVWITVHTLDYPGGLPVLNRKGRICEDSVIVLSIGENRSGMTYTLYKDASAYTCHTVVTDSITWTLSPATPGIYTVKISDGNCDVYLPDTVKVSKIPSSKLLEGDTVYCAGSLATLKVKEAESDVEYWLYKQGSADPIAKGKLSGRDVVFSGIGEDSYYVKAVSGECETVGGSCIVTEVDLPDISLNVDFKVSGDACAGIDNFIKVENTELGKMYSLHKKGKTDGIDSLKGTGSDIIFSALSTAGIYVVSVKDTLSGCKAFFPQALTINAAPALPVVQGCSYCEAADTAECSISLNSKSRGVYYRLMNGNTVEDVLYFADGYQFKALPEGRYRVIAVDSLTGCLSSAVEVGIDAVPSPKVLPVNGSCVLLGTTAVTISTLIAGEGDSVRYVLYKDGVATAKKQVGSGRIVSFGNLTNSGIYKIWAENSLGCGVFMEDSVVIYPNISLDGDSLCVNGTYCGENAEGVVLSYPESTFLWRYYVTDGTLYSDTIVGNGRELRFDKINHKVIHPGNYKLYAVAPCENEIKLVATGTVGSHIIPDVYGIAQDTAVLCSGESFEIKLDSSKSTVKYQVRYYSLSGEYVKSYGQITGSDGVLSVGSYSAAGIYKVYADNGCVLLMDSLVAVNGANPVVKKLLGNEICVSAGMTGDIHLSVSDRENGVSYYLYKDGVSAVDSLTAVFKPDTNAFEEQSQIGCYQAIAVHEQSGCRRPLEGIRCIGSITDVFGLLPETDDTVRICDKTKYCISLDGSEKGVRYVLYRDADSIQELGGTGSRLDYACVAESGAYSVKAKVATCQQWMNDTVRLKVMNEPPLSLDDTFRYCEGEGGAHISLLTTEPAFTYSLYTPDGREETHQGASNSGGLVFTDLSSLPGFYYVEVYDSVAGCYAKDSTVVVMKKLPRAYDLSTVQGHYICVNASITLTLSGSERNVDYTLFRTDDPVAVMTKQGTGGELLFSKLKTPGIYYVEAIGKTGERCQNIFGSWELKQADSVRMHNLVSIKDAYCYTDASKGTIGLDVSDKGVNYELMRDGESTGSVKAGTGGRLEWTGVRGKPCVGVPGEVNSGYKYLIMAQDTLSKCIAFMRGLDTLIESGNIAVWSYQPNEAVEKCEGERVDFNVVTSGCGEVYTWYHADTVVYRGKRNYYNIDSVAVENAGNYYCDVENTCSSSRTPDVNLTVRKKVQLSQPMEEVWACTVGGNVMISSGFVNANGYYWYKIGAPDRCLSTKDYLVLTNFKESMAGKYVCRAGGSALDCNVVYDTCEVVYGAFPAISGIAKIDTLCFGSVWQTAVVTVDNSTSIRWKRNEDTLNFSGLCYTVAPVGIGDAGNYIVEATNKCGTKTHVVGKLYVDQPLTVDTVSPSLQVGCMNVEKELFIKVSPANGQEQYEWLLDGKVVGRKNTYRIPPYSTGGTYLYQVWYANKCTSGVSYKEISIYVPEKLEFIEPERTIGVCAGDRASAQLLVTIDPSLMARFRWYFQKSEETTDRIDLNCTTNSYTVTLNRASTGYYYCDVYNECESKTTQTTWVRVDTVPTLTSLLVNDTVCANTDYRLPLNADGGSLKYSWKILKRGELVPEEREIPLNNELLFKNISSDYDSCRIWCVAKNDCGSVTSNEMILRVSGSGASLKVTPALVASCDGLARKVAVTAEGAGAFWSYKYLTPGNVEKQVNVIAALSDSLEVTENGIYRISWFKDAMGCVVTDSLPEIEVSISTSSEAVFTGGGDRCEGDTVSVYIHIDKGQGPWELTLMRQSGELATELAEDNGVLRMYGRDTVITFTVVDSQEYYIYQTVKDLGSTCPGVLQNDRVKVNVRKALHVDFCSGWPAYIGQCNNADLLDLLKPSIDGVAETKGSFYINDKPLNGSVWLKEDLLAGCYQVKYSYKDDHNCEVNSDEIRMCVDSLPYAEIILPEYACEGITDTLKIRFYPRPQDYTVKFYQYRYQHVPGGVKTDFRTELVPAANKGVYKEALGWVMASPVDSCLRYEVVGITDGHGCPMESSVSNSLRDRYYRDTVYLRQHTQLDVLTRYPDTANWIVTPYPINIPRGDSVGVKAILQTGMPLWTLTTSLSYWPWIENIPVRDTVFWLRDTGVYDFKAQDDHCLVAGNTVEVEVNWLTTGYFRGKLWLEGPYDPVANLMKSNISNQLLSAYGLSGWPTIVNGQRVIDYIQLELRSGNTAQAAAKLADGALVVARDTCLLLANGQLADRETGDTIVGLKNICKSGNNDYYVVVRHRNHIGLMSAGMVRFSKTTGMAPMLDLTRSANVYLKDGRPENHMSPYMNIWLLSAGELNDNSLISIFDPNRITVDDTGVSASGAYDLLHDVNFDGRVDWPSWNGSRNDADWSKVRRNRNKFSDLK